MPNHLSELAIRNTAHLAPALTDLGDGHLAVLLVLDAPRRRVGVARGVGEERVLGKVEAHALEPARDRVDGQGLVDDGGVGAGVDEVGGVEDLGPEGGAVGEGVGVEIREGLRVWIVGVLDCYCCLFFWGGGLP